MCFKHGKPGLTGIRQPVLVLQLLMALLWAAPGDALSNPDKEKYENAPRRPVLRYTTLIGPSLVTAAYGTFFWDWGTRSSWKWSKEREWGFRSDSGGSDKAGHFFMGYTLSRLTYKIFDYTETGGSAKWLYSVLSTAFVGLAIEIGDAYTDTYGFSLGDLAADFLGLSAGLLLERWPKAAEILGFSAEYFPSKGFRSLREVRFDITTDNTGWKYLVNLKPNGLAGLGITVPKALHYVTIDLGFFVQGYTRYDLALGLENKRRWLVGVSLNVPEILRSLGKGKNKFLGEILPEIFGYYHLPLGFRQAMDIDR